MHQNIYFHTKKNRKNWEGGCVGKIARGGETLLHTPPLKCPGPHYQMATTPWLITYNEFIIPYF